MRRECGIPENLAPGHCGRMLHEENRLKLSQRVVAADARMLQVGRYATGSVWVVEGRHSTTAVDE